MVAFQVAGLPEKPDRLAIHQRLSELAHENLVIFVDHADSPTQSLWLWVKREGSQRFPREHLYVKGQPGDLFISKISGIVVDINELDEHGRFPLARLVDRMKAALDVERVTRKFFKDYDAQRLAFVELIAGHSRRTRAPLVCLGADESPDVRLVPATQAFPGRRQRQLSQRQAGGKPTARPGPVLRRIPASPVFRGLRQDAGPAQRRRPAR